MSALPFDSHDLRLPGADLADPARVRVSKEEKAKLIAEAAGQHYQDQPWLTSALVGGGAGGLLGALLAPSGQAGAKAMTGASLGALTGIGNEALSRLLTRYVGPRFRPSRWAHDQDPHRWNSALKAAPLAASIPLAKLIYATHTQKESAMIKQADTLSALEPGSQYLKRMMEFAPDEKTRSALTFLEGAPSNANVQQDLLSRIATHGTLGATLPILAGAGIGAGVQQLRRDPKKRERDQPSRLKGALVGAGIGGIGGLLGAVDAPRSGYNASQVGQAMGSVSPSDYYGMLLRLVSPRTRENALETTLQNSFVRKWAPTGFLDK